MYCRAQRVACAAILTLIPWVTAAQPVWQPAQAPTVTAEKTSWYLSGEPITVNGELFYPSGAVQFFNRQQMVRRGSFNGIPLYIDTALQPDSIVFVPLSSERMQPYQRPQPGVLLNMAVSPNAALPAVTVIEASPSVPAPQPVGTSGRVMLTAAPRVSTLNPPTGVNGVWINFDGRRWFGAGKAIDYDAATLTRIGTYRGWNVYTRNGDRSVIYIPAVPGKLSPYRAR
jgi:hypothetical protein